MKILPTEEQIRLTGRAIGDLRRGFGIVLLYMGEAFWIQAAEAWNYELRDDTPPGSGRLILTRERAKYAGFESAPDYMTIRAGAPHELDDYIDQMLPIHEEMMIPEPQALMEAAIKLTKQAGWRPMVYMSQAEESIPTDVIMLDANVALNVLCQPAELVEITEHEITLPLKLAESARVRAFRDIANGITHLAVLIGDVSHANAPLCRVHSSCVTGDILGSLRCDCGDQLQAALHTISEAGVGILLYLNQEGRGIGLAHKMHAYLLQDQGMDTFDANEILGFAADERDFTIASTMLETMGITEITLLSNNPKKREALQQAGIKIKDVVSLVAESNHYNANYLDTKKTRMGHIL